jgi:hypothetical protein
MSKSSSVISPLAWAKQRPAGWNYYEFCRRENERLRQPAQEKRIRLKAPFGISHVSTLTGEQLAVDAEGCIEVIEEDARPLTAAGFLIHSAI